MNTLYDKNGLIFWTEYEIGLRRMLANHFVTKMRLVLRGENRAFDIMQVEAPLLTPIEFINKSYTTDDYFAVDGLVLRPETTMGSYRYLQWLLAHTDKKIRLPLCIWQHGKSFRREQDQVTKNMRLKEFYQLEFQCAYAVNTANDYSKAVVPAVQDMISEMIGPCRVEDSDRLPEYSERTVDVICENTNMEVCSISIRNDCKWSHASVQMEAKVLEVAIGTDRCVFNFLEKNKLK